ncbi:MAG TPA: type II toxin-antitoxin system prevent-host-death family antitoxin [Steroidobacteraceae bacterium]|nr:type II toxin-antitoxin system prevent-host-death family antitoxin [Steroidobacteraceae bacterium]
MAESISAAEANRQFSRLLRGVREEGATYIVTSHGKAVAKIVPVDAHDEGRARARVDLLARLRRQPLTGARTWTRDGLYEDEA